MTQIIVSVGQKKGDFVGRTQMALQAAVDYVARLGGGTVQVGPGVWEMGNSLFIREHVRIIGSGDDTVLRKCASAETPLLDDIDWYGTSVRVKDPSIFSVGSRWRTRRAWSRPSGRNTSRRSSTAGCCCAGSRRTSTGWSTASGP